MAIIPNNKLQEKRLKKLMGEDYYTKRGIAVNRKLESVQAVDRNGQWPIR